MKKEKQIGLKGTTIKPIRTEKAVMKIETDNVLTFETSKKLEKKDAKKEIEEIFGVEIEKIRSSIRGNKKYFFVKLKGGVLAIDIATKLGLI